MLLDRARREVLWSTVGELPAVQGRCLWLRFAEGRSVSETAEIMNRPSGAIRSLQYRAVRGLAEALRESATSARAIPPVAGVAA